MSEPTDDAVFRGIHDIGGQLDEPFEQTEHVYAPWEKRVHALRELLARKQLLSVDELRRAIEGGGAQDYEQLGYYEQWIKAMSQIMIEHGVIESDEFASKVEQVRASRG